MLAIDFYRLNIAPVNGYGFLCGHAPLEVSIKADKAVGTRQPQGWMPDLPSGQMGRDLIVLLYQDIIVQTFIGLKL